MYRPALEEVLKKDLTLEARVQVERLVSYAKTQSGQYDDLVELLDTMYSVKQLTELIPEADEQDRELLNARLQEISPDRQIQNE